MDSLEPMPMLSNEENSSQPRYFDIPVLLTPASRQSIPAAPLPYLPFGMEDESMPSLAPAVRLAPRYDHPCDFPY